MPSFGFAFVDPADTTFDAAYHREDDTVYAFTLSQVEGDFAVLDLEVKNPQAGLLSASRKQWLWFSVMEGSVVTPLFFGRIQGVPQETGTATIVMKFIGRPADYETRKAAAADALKVLPWFDPVWLDEAHRDDPDSVLEFRPSLWHIDPVTHAVSAVAIDNGPAGTIDLAGDFFPDSLSVQPGTTPLKKLTVSAQVQWEQAAEGEIDLLKPLVAAFHAAGSKAKYQGYIQSYTGAGLMSDWPREGGRIGNVWTYGVCDIVRHDGFRLPDDYKQVILKTADIASFPRWTMKPVLAARYDVSRRRTETVTFTLEADTQDVLAESGDLAESLMELSSTAVTEAIDAGGALPIGDVRRASYFITDRGRLSIEALINLARAQMIAAARCVTVGCDIGFDDFLTLTLKHNIRIAHDDLPGGEAAGKVMALTCQLSGDQGQLTCSISFGCMAGQGATVTGAAGTPDYVEAGYVADGYQTYSNVVVLPDSGDVTYDDYLDQPLDDDGVDLLNFGLDQAVDQIYVINGPALQESVLNGYAKEAFTGSVLGPAKISFDDLQQAIEAVESLYTQVDLTMVPIGKGPFETHFTLSTSKLMIARTIDLEAA